MKKAGRTARAWIVGFHLFFAGIWVGAILCMQLLIFVKIWPGGEGQLHAYNAALKLLDDFAIIPAAFGSLITGLLISLLTNWGFFKWRWVIFKWIVTVGAIVFGTFWLGPWTNGMEQIARELGQAALNDPAYLHNRLMGTVFGLIQTAVIFATVFISVFKPWGKRGS